MKRIMILMIVLILSIFIILGCSSNRPDFGDGQIGRGANMTEEQRQQMMEERGQIGRGANMTEEQRQRMFEERQQKTVEACQEKSEGDSCILESPRGEIEGVCKMMDESLVCTMDRAEGLMRQRIE